MCWDPEKCIRPCGDFDKDDPRDIDAIRRAWYNGVPHWTAWLKHPRYYYKAAENPAQRSLLLSSAPASLACNCPFRVVWLIVFDILDHRG